MTKNLSLVLVISSLLAVAVACSSTEKRDATVSSAVTIEPTTDIQPRSTTVTVDSTATALSPAENTGILPEPFTLSDYANGDEIADLMAEAGDERAFPVELLSDSPELTLGLAKALAEDYLNDTRVVVVKKGFRETRIEGVLDYCDNSTRQVRYLRTSTGPGLFNNPNIFPAEGDITEWTIQYTDLTPWYEPYVAGVFDSGRAAYVARGWDAASVLRLRGPDADGLVKLLGNAFDQHVRVFDYPGCDDPAPVLEYSPTQWSLIGMEKMLVWPDGLTVDDPQLDPAEVVRIYDQKFQNIASFSNLNGFPFLYFCENHRGVVLGKNSAKLGESFAWRIEDGSDIASNGIWIVYEYDNTDLGIGYEFLFQESEFNPLRAVVAAEISDCSVESGLEYVDSIAESIDWFKNRPATPTPRLAP